MATTQKLLNAANIVPGLTVTTLYTVPALTTATVQTITLANTTGTAANVTFYRVPSGGTAATVNIALGTYSVPANGTVIMDSLRWVQSAGTSIQAVQGTANAINVFLDGVEVS